MMCALCTETDIPQNHFLTVNDGKRERIVCLDCFTDGMDVGLWPRSATVNLLPVLAGEGASVDDYEPIPFP